MEDMEGHVDSCISEFVFGAYIFMLHYRFNPNVKLVNISESWLEMFACDLQAFLCFHGILGLLEAPGVPVKAKNPVRII